MALCCLAAVPALAGPLESAGDGSWTSNPDLLRDSVAGMGGACSDCDPGASVIDLDRPFFDVGWSVALRGSYVQDSSAGEYVEGTLEPTITLTHGSENARLEVTGSAQIVRSSVEQVRVAALTLAVTADYLFNVSTLLKADANFMLSRGAPNAPGNPAGTEVAPQTIEGDAGVSVQETLGPFEVTVRGNLAREIVGETTLAGGILEDNTWQNNTSIDGGLRVGLKVTPIVTAFADVSAGYALYDAPSPTLLVPFDGPTYTARAGLSAKWGTILSSEVSVGAGIRQYTAAGLSEFAGILYDASVTFTPDESWTFNASLATTLSPPDTSGSAGRITHAFAGSARYVVNPWLALRASASWDRTEVIGTGAVENSIGLGVGSDYAVNDNTTVTADYTFSEQDTPLRAAHRVMLGLVFTK